jgi:hypothetical protein
MRSGQLAFAALLAAGCAAAMGGEPAAMTAEHLLFVLPEHFKVGYRSEHDGGTLTEFVAEGETVEEWSQRLTIQVFRNVDADAPVFLERVGDHYVKD